MALEEQMAMNFGDVPDNTVGQDPVSGNDIPLGSTAENVRDDIPTMLSEGEMVIPADVVNYWGVKLFEDLRAQAKMGYAQMQEDGRIGGEPIEDDGGMGLEMSDLEVMDVPDDTPDTMPESEEAFLGKFFAGLRSGNKDEKQSVRDRFSQAKERQSVTKIKSGQSTKPRFKNRAEEILFRLFGGDDKDDRKPPSINQRDKKEASESTIDFGFRGNPMERASRKYGSPAEATKNQPLRNLNQPSAGEVTQPFVGGINLRDDDRTFIQKLLQGAGMDEGGLSGNTGGFGEEMSFDAGEARTGLMEARTYRNDAGHEIVIMFLNGQPLTDIPDGYYPVGDSTVVTPEAPEIPQSETGSSGGGGGSGGGSGRGATTPTPPAVDYQSLTPDELAEFVKNQGSISANALAAGLGILNPVVGLVAKYAMYDQAKKVQAEIERRLADTDLAIYEREFFQNLLDEAKADKPGLLERLFGADEEAKAKAEPYSTEQKADSTNITTKQAADQVQSIVDNVTEPYVGKTAAQQIQDSIDIKRIEDEMKAQPRPMDDDTFDAMGGYDQTTDPVSQPEVRGDDRKTRDAQRRRDRQEANKNITGSTASKRDQVGSATRGLGTTEKKGGAELDSRFGITGLADGGLVDKPKVKKVVKGLEKASKTHAKQAAELKAALGAKKKKSK